MSGIEHGLARLTAEREPGLTRPVLLELVGLPGAGKTTIAARLVAELRARGISCAERRGDPASNADRARRRLHRGAFLLRNPELAAASLRFAASVRPASLARLGRAVRLSGWARQLAAFAASDVDVVVLDQGPVQDAWSVTLPGRVWSESAMRKVVGRLVQTRMPRAFAYVTVDIETAARRLRERRGSGSRFDRLGATATRRWLALYEHSLWSIFEYAVIVANAPFVRIDGTLPIEEQCRQASHFLDTVRSASSTALTSVSVGGES